MREVAVLIRTPLDDDAVIDAVNEHPRLLFLGIIRDEHVVTFTEDGYGLEHPLRCRKDLIGCVLDEWLRTQMAPDREPGRYIMEWHEGGPTYREVPLPECSNCGGVGSHTEVCVHHPDVQARIRG